MSIKSKRSFGLSAEDVQKLTAEFTKSKRLPNPYRAGAYGFTIDALIALGINTFHPLGKVQTAFKKAAGRDWYAAWSGSKKRNDTTGKNADDRFVQNLHVLQRTADYSLKLLQVGKKILKSKGAVIDLNRDSKGAMLVRLNTDSAAPLKPGRAQTTLEPSGKRQDAMGSKSGGKTPLLTSIGKSFRGCNRRNLWYIRRGMHDRPAPLKSQK